MKKKLTKLEIQNISKKLGWKYRQTLDYIDKYKEKDSIIDYRDLIRTCYKSPSPIKRFNNIVSLLYQNCEDTISTLTALMNQDVLIYTIIIFNISDFIKDKNIELVTVGEPAADVMGYDADGKEVLIQEGREIFNGIERITQERFSEQRELIKQDRDTKIIATFKDRKHLDSYEPDMSKIFKRYLDQYELTYNLCDSYISRKELYEYTNMRYPFRTSIIIDNLILKLLPALGFRIFNIEYFRNHITAKSEYEFLKDEEQFLRKLRDTIFDINENRNEVTNKRYWFYYCLVAKVVESGYKVVPACKKLATPLSVQWKHLKNKYYEKKTEVQKRGDQFNLDEFIKEQGFTSNLKQYLEEVEAAT